MFGGFAPMPMRLGGSDIEGWVSTQHARVNADSVACVRSCPFAWLTFTLINGDPPVPSIRAYNSMAGDGIAFAPLITTLSDSAVNIVWSPIQEDAYERPEPLAIRHAKVTVLGSTIAYATCEWQPGESEVVVRCFDLTGSPSWAADAITLRVT